MHMITYTNVLTILHISHPTYIPVPEGSVELFSIIKDCGWGCMRIRMECTEEEEEGTTLVWLHSRISYSVERERERERESQYITLWCKCVHGWCTWSHTRMYSLSRISVTLLTSQFPIVALNCWALANTVDEDAWGLGWSAQRRRRGGPHWYNYVEE